MANRRSLGILVFTMIGVIFISGGSPVKAQPGVMNPPLPTDTCTPKPDCPPNCLLGTPLPLNIYWRGIPKGGGADLRTTYASGERNTFLSQNQGLRYDGAIFYVPRISAATPPPVNFNRLLFTMNNNPVDHRDALVTTETVNQNVYNLDTSGTLPSGLIGFV